MASVTKNSNEKSMADELPDEPTPEKQLSKGDKPKPVEYASKSSAPARLDYFTPYKRGQGYWTRVGTVIGAIVIGAFTAWNLYQYIPTFLSYNHATSLKIGGAVAGVFILAYAWLCWKLLNKPANVDFLIATDSEMKKVNWTSRKELVGSTQIVVIFMFLVAFFLFSVDWIFGTIMWLAKVLSVPPWGV